MLKLISDNDFRDRAKKWVACPLVIKNHLFDVFEMLCFQADRPSKGHETAVRLEILAGRVIPLYLHTLIECRSLLHIIFS